ncbi:MAG: FAD-dependent oxidoreductase, partial [Actinomycetota bacterium]
MDTEPVTPTDYDVAVLGGGTGGYSAALRAAQLGKRVALIDRGERLGGTCLLRGCIPTKALLRSAEVLDTVNRSATWGIEASGSPDWSAILAFQAKTVDKLVKGLEHLVASRGIERIQAHGRLVTGPAIEADGRVITAGDVVLALGSQPKTHPGIELGPRVVTSDEALTLGFIPGSVVVIGGGAIGLEFASFYRSMGATVTLLETLPRIAATEDEEISAQLVRAFRRRKIEVHVGAQVESVTPSSSGDAVIVTYAESEGESGGATVEAELCLVAVGRAPVSEDAGLEQAGVAIDRRLVKVNDDLTTTVPNVWEVRDAA